MKTLPLTSFLALRNVVRYKRRNLGTFSILFCGALCIMLVDAFMTGFARDTRERLVASCGHVDAHAPGYLESAEASPLDLCVPEAGAALATMLRAAASVSDRRSVCVAAASLTTGGLVSDGESRARR
jgi:ABC-type lipoprotein release transport system permease subunit